MKRLMYCIFEREGSPYSSKVRTIYGCNRKEIAVAKLEKLKELHPERFYALREHDLDAEERFERERDENS